MRTLKWNPVIGPEPAEEGVRRRVAGQASDSVEILPLLLAPIAARQVGTCLVGQAPDQKADQRFGQTRPYRGRAWLNLIFSEDAALERILTGNLIAALDEPGERLAWMMSVYQAMCERGHWPVNLVMEQLLADEAVFIERGEIQPPCPAAIQ